MKFVEVELEIETEIYDLLVKYAEKEGLTINDFIVKIILEYIEEIEGEKNEIQKNNK